MNKFVFTICLKYWDVYKAALSLLKNDYNWLLSAFLHDERQKTNKKGVNRKKNK